MRHPLGMASTTTYHHGDLPSAVRRAALDVIAERGPDGFSVREVARRAGVSHTAPRHHFGDRRDLLTALATDGFRALAAVMDEAAAGAVDPLDAVTAQVRAYVHLHRTKPGYAAVMWRTDLVDRDDPALAEAARDTLRRLHRSVVRAMPDLRGSLDGVALVWALAHGVSQLGDRLDLTSMADALGLPAERSTREDDELAERMLRLVMAGAASVAGTPH